MSTYSAGLLKVDTLTATGSSGSINATNATVTNLKAINVYADDFSFDKLSLNLLNNLDVSGNVDVSGNLTVDSTSNLKNVNVSGNLNVIGKTLLTDNLSVLADAGVSGDLNVEGLTALNDLTVQGDFNLTGFNEYEGTYVAGEVISYTKKGTMTAAEGNLYFQKFLGPTGAAFVPTTTYDIDYYEMVYWAVDSRSNDTIRQSATVCIPSTIVNTAIVSYKHGTLASTYQGATLWQAMQNIDATQPTDPSGGTPGLSWAFESTAWMLATTGYVTVCADNPGYGVSVGFYNYQDPIGECYSQYNAVLALKQLTQKAQSLFSRSFSAPYKVINTSYSLGSLFSPMVSQLIETNEEFELINTVAGSMINAYELINNSLFGGTTGTTVSSNPTLFSIFLLSCIYLNGNTLVNAPLFNIKPNIATGVLPIFNQMYLTTPKNIGAGQTPLAADYWIGRIISLIQAATIVDPENPSATAGVVDVSGNAYLRPTLQGLPYIVPDRLFNSPFDYLAILKQNSFFNNIFMDYTNLAGTPINSLYSVEDPLVCYNPATPYLGSLATDIVNGPFEAFVTTVAPQTNGLNRGASAYLLKDLTALPTPISITANITDNVTRLLTSEGTQNCSNFRWKTAAFGPLGLTHNTFLVTVFQTVVRTYLQLRAGRP